MIFKSLVRVVAFCFLFVALTVATVKFTNIKCEVYDKNFCNISQCQLKVVRRGVVSLNIHTQLLQTPVDDVKIIASFFKKASGYRPFLYNTTIDFCDFFKNKKKYPFIKIVFDMLKSYSNINHTCPYNHDIILKDLVLKDTMFKSLPLPGGEYMFQLIIFVADKARGVIKAYLQQNE